MVLKFTTVGDVRVYNVSTNKSLPEWLKKAKGKPLRYDDGRKSRDHEAVLGMADVLP